MRIIVKNEPEATMSAVVDGISIKVSVNYDDIIISINESLDDDYELETHDCKDTDTEDTPDTTTVDSELQTAFMRAQLEESANNEDPWCLSDENESSSQETQGNVMANDFLKATLEQAALEHNLSSSNDSIKVLLDYLSKKVL